MECLELLENEETFSLMSAGVEEIKQWDEEVSCLYCQILSRRFQRSLKKVKLLHKVCFYKGITSD